jgi:outer membrane protein OmpA-like peptidoglycan-associated protein
MSDQQDGAEKFALTLLALLVAAVVAGSVGFSVSRARPSTSAAASNVPADAMAVSPVETLYFAVGDDQLPPEANDVLSRVAVAARSNAGATIAVSGFHDASGDRAANQVLALRRAEQVRHALEANGVSPSQIILDKPAETSGGGDAAQARRVEMRLQ